MKSALLASITIVCVCVSSGGLGARPLRRRFSPRFRAPIEQRAEAHYLPDPEPIGRCYGSEYNYGPRICGTATGGPVGGLYGY